jgi:hypothetical protein
VLQSEETSQEIRQDELVKGYEIVRNEFAAIDPQEIKAPEIETSDTIDLFHFVKATKVDPIYFERSYYVAPGSGAEKVRLARPLGIFIPCHLSCRDSRFGWWLWPEKRMSDPSPHPETKPEPPSTKTRLTPQRTKALTPSSPFGNLPSIRSGAWSPKRCLENLLRINA